MRRAVLLAALGLLAMENVAAEGCINPAASKAFAPDFVVLREGDLSQIVELTDYDAGSTPARTLPQVLSLWQVPADITAPPSPKVYWDLLSTLNAYSFAPPAMSAGGMPSHLLLQDVSGDGQTDLLLATGPYLLYYQGFGLGRFGSSATTSGVPRQAISIATPTVLESFSSIPAVLDVEGNGLPELLVAHSEGLSWWSQSAGQFTTRHELLVGTAVEALAVLDLNGDQRDDIALVASGQLQSWLNDGAGGFNAGSSITLAATPQPRLVRLHTPDLDGDGKADLVLENSVSEWWLVGAQGLGTGGNATTPHGVLVADVDYDGDVDLLPRQGLAICGSAETALPALRNDGLGQLQTTVGNYATQSMWQLRDIAGGSKLEVFGHYDNVVTNSGEVDTWAALNNVSMPQNGTQLNYSLMVKSAPEVLAADEVMSYTLRYPASAWVDTSDPTVQPLAACPLEVPPDLAEGEAMRRCSVDVALLADGIRFDVLFDRAVLMDQLVTLELSLPQRLLDLAPSNNRLQLRYGQTPKEPAKKPSSLLGSFDWSLLLFMLMLLIWRYIYDLEDKCSARRESQAG